MQVVLTVKILPESEEDYATLGEQVGIIRKHFEMLKNESALGPPDQIELRYLISNEGQISEVPAAQPNIQEEINGPATN